jgi:hypothetical protein
LHTDGLGSQEVNVCRICHATQFVGPYKLHVAINCWQKKRGGGGIAAVVLYTFKQKKYIMLCLNMAQYIILSFTLALFKKVYIYLI